MQSFLVSELRLQCFRLERSYQIIQPQYPQHFFAESTNGADCLTTYPIVTIAPNWTLSATSGRNGSHIQTADKKLISHRTSSTEDLYNVLDK